MNKEKFAKMFPFGSHLCREPMPAMSEMKKDMELLKKAGFNLIKLQEHWMYDEPREGEFHFEKYEELIGHAAKLDLGIYLGLTCEQAPPWLYIKHPGCRMVGRNGVPVAYEAQSTMPGDGKPGACFDNPDTQKKQLGFIRKLVGTLGKYENIVVWNTWQEVAYWSEGITGQHVCYCEHTLRFFREWLKSKHGSLDALNKAWRTNYGEWDYVAPDRHAAGTTCIPQNFEWKYFMDNVHISNILKTRAETIKAADPLKRPVFAHLGGPVIGSGREWNYARSQDFLGTSLYPSWWHYHGWDDKKTNPDGSQERHASLSMETWHTSLKMDYIRSCNPAGNPVWAAEFQGGPVSCRFHKGRTPSPADMRRWLLGLMSSGTTGVCFWVTRAEIIADEVNGFSLLDSEGDTTDRFEEAAKIGRAFNAHADILAKPNLERPKAAIIVNEDNFQLAAAMTGNANGHICYSVRCWHRLMRESGIDVDFADISRFDGKLESQYKVLILPVPLSLSEAFAEKLAAYVKNGGCLISEACAGRIDENGFCNRGELSPALRKVFGARHKSLTLVKEPGNGHRWNGNENSWGDFAEAAELTGEGALAGHKLRANTYLETFSPDGASAVLRHGDDCAGTVNKFGKGKAWLLGTFAGHNGGAYRDKETWAALLAILKDCGVEPVTAGKLLLSKRVSPEKEAWVFFNPDEKAVTETVSVKGWKKVSDLLGGPLKTEKGSVKISVDSLDGKVLILER
jgi:beta-galactosidase GanA